MNYILPKRVKDRKWANEYFSRLQSMTLEELFEEALEWYPCDSDYTYTYSRDYWEHKIMKDYLWSKIEERE